MAHVPSLHLNQEYFPKPKEFIPERWIPEDSPFPNHPIQEFTFYPFSAGSRNCVGKNFAMMEMRLVLATLVLTYEMNDIPNQRDDYVQFVTTALTTERYMIGMLRR
jgi:cytochrome P450